MLVIISTYLNVIASLSAGAMLFRMLVSWCFNPAYNRACSSQNVPMLKRKCLKNFLGWFRRLSKCSLHLCTFVNTFIAKKKPHLFHSGRDAQRCPSTYFSRQAATPTVTRASELFLICSTKPADLNIRQILMKGDPRGPLNYPYGMVWVLHENS